MNTINEITNNKKCVLSHAKYLEAIKKVAARRYGEINFGGERYLIVGHPFYRKLRLQEKLRPKAERGIKSLANIRVIHADDTIGADGEVHYHVMEWRVENETATHLADRVNLSKPYRLFDIDYHTPLSEFYLFRYFRFPFDFDELPI